MRTELVIIGAGIIGSALAEACARRGLRPAVLESGIPSGGTTAAGMGHLVVLDDNPAEMALSRDGLERWRARRNSLPAEVEYRECGTLWLARNGAELEEAERKQALYQAQGLPCRLLNATELGAIEPNLATSLAGALQVPEEAVIYPPVAGRYLLDQAVTLGATLLPGAHAVAVEDNGAVWLADGRCLIADHVVIAAGCASSALLPGLPLAPRKGQLVITDRYPGYIRHQLVELGYLQSAHGGDADSVAFNVQPRATGQLLIGSSRQYDDTSSDIEWALLQRMLLRAFDYLPGLHELQTLRAWTGLRPAIPDKLPLLGRAPGRQRLWLATGHEGLGITTALASAELLASLLVGERPTLDPAPYDPARFAVRPTVPVPAKAEAP
ncbi:MAG: FAD-binding oxidoreductase [Burkholderiales bacterium]|nr:FAD-binding oxidoreductase [Burkholderiales bacterium]